MNYFCQSCTELNRQFVLLHSFTWKISYCAMSRVKTSTKLIFSWSKTNILSPQNFVSKKKKKLPHHSFYQTVENWPVVVTLLLLGSLIHHKHFTQEKCSGYLMTMLHFESQTPSRKHKKQLIKKRTPSFDSLMCFSPISSRLLTIKPLCFPQSSRWLRFDW